MLSNNYFTEDPDLQLIFEIMVDWETVVRDCEGENFADHALYQKTGDSRYQMAPANTKEAIDLYRASLESMGAFFGTKVSQISGTIDKQGLLFQDGKVVFPPELLRIYEEFRNTGLMPYSISREAGGLAMPATMWAFFTMIMARADVSFCMTITLLNLAQIIARYGTNEQIETFAAKASSGESLFAMALTEPDYGSDLNNVRTTATKREDGKYVLNGTKRFISQGCGLGDHPALLLTLARTGKQNGGARGLSVFLVKSSDVKIAGIETKMGIHSSPTCEVVYEESLGEILGEEGQGLTKYTLGMTNFMRLGSAAGGPGGAAGAYFECQKYANERVQFGKPIAEIPAVAEMLGKIKRETNAMRLLTLETARVIDSYQHHQIRLEKAGLVERAIRKEERIQKGSNLAALLTSIAKYYCSEEANVCASLAVQIHGGAGYTEDYDVARMFRDSRINTIYEGTSQIHVRIATGGILAGMSSEGLFRKYIEELLQTIPKPSSRLLELTEIFENALVSFRELGEELCKERVAENLMVITARTLTALLYEKALVKIEDQAILIRWKSECSEYLIDCTAIALACRYRIQSVLA
ncbi:acyl-CoA dehydrogenase [Leptospira ognonensis]|uniref:Acyl-CoA dehydrogenase n=1 Tax=Leptospira ognonensis TaxID=2484945 RepID=A0A4R9K8C3_9LEPT|nr:acyl-CoA dehydrogenase family protein [Leptospira ognonensis]TGL61912.1 acyl-CoA dehydrogenase [Leptospira ognonensis]